MTTLFRLRLRSPRSAFGHEQFGFETCRRAPQPEQFGLELTAERLRSKAHVESLSAERLKPNGVSICSDPAPENTSFIFANRSTKLRSGKQIVRSDLHHPLEGCLTFSGDRRLKLPPSFVRLIIDQFHEVTLFPFPPHC